MNNRALPGVLFYIICIFSISCTHLKTNPEPLNSPGTDAMRTAPEELETNMEIPGVSSTEADDPDIQINF